MKIEVLPLIAGAIVALIGIGLLLDAWLPDYTLLKRERRRTPRRDRDRAGELLLGLGMLCMAGALIGRDTWRYRILVAIIGAVLLVLGTLKNSGYIRDRLSRRGASRRADPPMGERGVAAAPPANSGDAARPSSAAPGEGADENRTRIR
jgi:peptidoglycan/LPS O-acetylase OafA/YrhL